MLLLTWSTRQPFTHKHTHTNTLHLRDTQPVFRVTYVLLLLATYFSKNHHNPTKKKQVFYSDIFLNEITVFCITVRLFPYRLSKFTARHIASKAAPQ